MARVKVKVEKYGFIKVLAFPVHKSDFTDKEEDAYVFYDREYIEEKLRGSMLDGHYEITEVKD